jgi:hypothetical protein
MILIVITLILLSGISKGIQDQLMFHWGKGWTSKLNPLFWNPAVSWKNKYKNGDPEQGEKFWGSTTIFVGFTDAWHLFANLRENANRLAIIVALYGYYDYKITTSFIMLISAFIIFTIGFKLFYKKVKIIVDVKK